MEKNCEEKARREEYLLSCDIYIYIYNTRNYFLTFIEIFF